MKFYIQGNTGAKYLLDKENIGWQLYKWRESEPITRGVHSGKNSTAGYRSLGKYPHDIKHALTLIADDHMASTNEKFVFKDGMKAMKEFIQSIDIKASEVR